MAAALLAATPAAAAPGPLAPLLTAAGPAAAGRYIVIYTAPTSGLIAAPAERMAVAAGGTVQQRYSHAVSGFAATLTPAALAAVRRDPAVAYIQPDALTSVAGTVQSPVRVPLPQRLDDVVPGAQPNPPSWGLDRIDQRALPLDRYYNFASSGSAVAVYLVDSGIRATNVEFGGRASGLYDAMRDGRGASDCNGHGTHAAGVIGGVRAGVAKTAEIYAVRVADCAGRGQESQLLEAVDWLAAQPHPNAIVDVSVQGYGQATRQALDTLMASGIHGVFAANTSNRSACADGPLRGGGIVVGATDRYDTRWAGSGNGSCLDLFAPGVDITAASIGGDYELSSGWTGTGMAAAHVAGWLARYLEDQPRANSAQSKSALVLDTTRDVVRLPGGAPNRLLFADPRRRFVEPVDGGER